jgi:predicted nuclease of restriction endonuclease-like RecB superfamily
MSPIQVLPLSVNKVSGDEKEAVLLEIIKKYTPDFMEKGKEYIRNASKVTTVMKIEIEHITGKARR